MRESKRPEKRKYPFETIPVRENAAVLSDEEWNSLIAGVEEFEARKTITDAYYSNYLKRLRDGANLPVTWTRTSYEISHEQATRPGPINTVLQGVKSSFRVGIIGERSNKPTEWKLALVRLSE